MIGNSWIRRNLDIVACVAGLVGLAVSVALILDRRFHAIYLVACGVGFAAVLLYVCLRKELTANIERAPAENSRRDLERMVWLASFSAALVLVLLALQSFQLRSDIYLKPTQYYLYAAGSVAFLFYCIALSSEHRRDSVAILALTCTIGLMHVWTESAMFPGSLIGIDAWTHQRITMQELAMAIGETKNVLGLVRLSWNTIGGYYSLMHLYLKQIIELTGLSYRAATLIFWSCPQIAGSTVLLYLVGSRVAGRRAGLVAALLGTMGCWMLFFTEWAIPNTVGVVLSLLVAYLGLLWRGAHKAHCTRRIALAAGVVAILVASLMTHIIVAAWATGTVMCVFILPEVLTRRKTWGLMVKRIAMSSTLPVIAVLSLVTWLQVTTIGESVKHTMNLDIYTPASCGLIADSADKTTITADTPEITPTTLSKNTPTSLPANPAPPSATPTPALDAPPPPPEISDHLKQGSLLELTMNSLGLLLYMGLALMGCLRMLGRGVSPVKATWVSLCTTTLAFAFLPPLFHFSLIEHRWLYLAQAFLAVPLGVILVHLARLRQRTAFLVGTACLAGVVAFFSTIGLPSNLTNRVMSPNQIVRYALTEGEIEGKQVADEYDPSVLGADPYYMAFLQADTKWHYPLNQKALSVGDNILTGDFRECPCDVILLRNALSTEPFAFGSGAIYALGYDPIERAKSQGYVEVWSNGEICCLVREP